MSLDLSDCTVAGSALTEPFLREGLERVVALGAADGWDAFRGGLCRGGVERVHRHVTTPLAAVLGYRLVERQAPVMTREGNEHGGWLFLGDNGVRLRVWSVASAVALDGMERTARRASPTRSAQRVLTALGERVGLVINGDALRLLLCDPVGTDSHFTIDISGWRRQVTPPDSFRVLLGLAGAGVVDRFSSVLESARLHQVRVTTALRRQAKEAITGFINALPDRGGLDAATLWREGLILVYRLLFILKLESAGEPGCGFSFAASRLWREALSPKRGLGALVRRHLDRGHETGQMLEQGLRTLFTAFRDGLTCSELHITPLAGGLFAAATTPALDCVAWGERAVAILLDRLIWVTVGRGERARVHYGSLDVEDLGSIYEGLLEQTPVITDGVFCLRDGNGRKASGSFYTPHAFVRFLVRETLDARIAALSPADDPQPAQLLTLKIVDPATGSGHFLVEACRYLADALLTACLACDARGLADRIAALPDPDHTLVAYLPSHGYAESRARAICRRLVAVHCLYGCDRNELAVELAKLSLWLESYAEGLPLTFLDHRLVHGDALTGPFFAALGTLPVTGGPLDPLLARGVTQRLNAAMARARRLVAAMNATIGQDVADVASKQRAKIQLDGLLHPLRELARAWTGAAMLRGRDCDDEWLALAGHVAATGEWPATLSERQVVMLEAGAASVAWDLTFPEIFPRGFSAVLGNPPWDVVLPNTVDFVAEYDPGVRGARTRGERAAIERRVLAAADVSAAFEAYRAGFERTKAVAARLYRHQRVREGKDTASGSLDLFRLFAERAITLAAADGAIGMLMPSAFHANAGATGVRLLYMREAELRWCLSFENRRRVFDIDSRFKFDLIVAQRPGPTQALRCGFYLGRIEDVADAAKIMPYTTDFLRRTGGAALTPLELRGSADLAVAETLFAQTQRLGAWCARRGIRFGNDLHMTADAACFRPVGAGDLVLHEGKTFHQYTTEWDTKPRHSVDVAGLKPTVAAAARHYRLVFRDIARSNDERTMIACLAPPGAVFGHTATVEKAPHGRKLANALLLCALFNSFVFDWLVRLKTATHLSLYLLDALPVPVFTPAEARFLALAAARLSRRVDDRTWRDVADAVIARSYRLDRGQYAHILSGFSHRRDLQAPARCLEAFDRLETGALIGLDLVDAERAALVPATRSADLLLA